MIVASDTGPLNYLLLIGEVDVLPRLYGRIFIPPAVADELTRPAAPLSVRQWMEQRPDWLNLRSADSTLGPSDLHMGERETIALALTMNAGLVLLDEKKGRVAAQSQGLRVIGTLGVLLQADAQHLLSLTQAVEKLRRTSFQISEALLAAVLLRASQPQP